MNVFFIYTGILIVVISFLIIYFNIGLPSGLKGFLFFIQVYMQATIYIARYLLHSTSYLNNALHVRAIGSYMNVYIYIYIHIHIHTHTHSTKG